MTLKVALMAPIAWGGLAGSALATQAPSPQAPAQPPKEASPPAVERFGILSVVGEPLSLITGPGGADPGADASPGRQERLDGAAIDKLVLASAEKALRKARPQLKPMPLVAKDLSLHAAQDELFTAPDAHATARAGLQSWLREAQVSKLLLITRFRAEPISPLPRAQLGNTPIAGLGFYLEYRGAKDGARTSRALSYVAPFAYLKVSLIDADTLRVERSATATDARTLALRGTGTSLQLRDALDAQETLTQLTRVTDDALNRAISLLMGP